MAMETPPTPVTGSNRSKQVGSIRSRWNWVEPSAWTDRMLTALERGVKGGVWFSLIDKVYSERVLRASFTRVKANGGTAGVDHQTIEAFETRLDANLTHLSASLQNGTYRPQAIRRVWIPKPGRREKRPLGIPTVRDRVVQGALRAVLEPIFEADFAEASYGFRPGRGCKDALRRVQALLDSGHTWVVDADLKSYFDTIGHDRLMAQVQAKVADSRVLRLIEAYLKQSVLETARAWTPESGSPQGAVLSPLLSNLYLDPLDQLMADHGFQMVRYADDFVVLCRTRAEAERALATVQAWTAEAGLSLHPEKTVLVDASQPGGFDFLGYHFERGMHWASRRSVQKLKTSLRPKTRRANGHSLAEIISDVNRTLRGWFEYFKHSRRTAFVRLDKWIRMRLRSVLRIRAGRRGRGRGRDHQRWPNAFFAEHGLFSLVAAHATLRQSSRR